NDLVVDVDNRKGPEPREGWWNWGGITRPVELVAQGPVVFDDFALLPHVDCDGDGHCRDAQVLLDGWLTNRTAARTRPTVSVRLLDKLDAAGILVWTQAPIFHRDVLLRTPRQRANALATLRQTILATRDHPSTLLYSVANELNATPSKLPPTRAYMLEAARETRDLDPTRP